MSIQLVQPYYNNIGQLIRYGNTCNEMSLRQANPASTCRPPAVQLLAEPSR